MACLIQNLLELCLVFGEGEILIFLAKIQMKKFLFSDSRKMNYNIILVLNSLHAKTETLTSVSGDKIWTITEEN